MPPFKCWWPAELSSLCSSRTTGILAGGMQTLGPLIQTSWPGVLSELAFSWDSRSGLDGLEILQEQPFFCFVLLFFPLMFVSFHFRLWPRRAVPRHKGRARPEGGGSKAPSARRETGTESKRAGGGRAGGFACRRWPRDSPPRGGRSVRSRRASMLQLSAPSSALAPVTVGEARRIGARGAPGAHALPLPAGGQRV